MFSFREFRNTCRTGESEDILSSLQELVNEIQWEELFKCASFISELINLKRINFTNELQDFFSEQNLECDIDFNFSSKSRRIGILVKHGESFPIELLSCINRIHWTPVVILIGKRPGNTEFREKLAELSIACLNIDSSTNFTDHVQSLSDAVALEKVSSLIIHASSADLDFKFMIEKFPDKCIVYHPDFTFPCENAYAQIEGSLGTGSWKANRALPLFSFYTAFLLPEGLSLQAKILKLIPADGKLLLLCTDPLKSLKEIDESDLGKIVFLSQKEDYPNGLKSCKEILISNENFQETLDLAFEYGLPVRKIEDGTLIEYEDLRKKFSLRSKFTTVLNHLFGSKPNHRKRLPRIVFFQNHSSARIINSINRDISAALKHAGCPVLDLDISPMDAASKNRDWQRLREIQQDAMDRINHFKPDQAVGYNDVGIFPNGESHILEKMGIPFNGLFFDNPFYFMDNLKHCQNKELTRILTLDRYYIPSLQQAGFKNTFYFPIATSMHNHSFSKTASFDSERFLFTATVKEKFGASDISQSMTNKNDIAFVKYAFDQIMSKNQYSVNKIIEDYSHFYSKDYVRFQNEVWFKLENQCSSQLRIQAMESLKDIDIDIYGGNNWEKLELSPRHSYKGYLDYNLLPEAVRSYFGVICRTPLNIQDGVQQRILDCGAANGLILTDYRPVLEEHFEIDKELFVYRDNDELLDKVKFLKNNPGAVKKSKKLLHKKVLQEHTWDLRVQELINLMLG